MLPPTWSKPWPKPVDGPIAGTGSYSRSYYAWPRRPETRILRSLFDVANSLHSNFYENWMPQDWIEAGAKEVGEFLEKLEGLP